jgi:hypothetical protein
MRKLLLAAFLIAVAAVPARAADLNGGTLIPVGQFPMDVPGRFETLVLVSDYSNISNFTGQGFANGGSALQGSNTITRLVADDITPTGVHAGMTVAQWTFSVANFNAVPVIARPRVRFYLADGSSGGPGTLLVGFSFNAITIPAGSVQLLTATGAGFPMPGTRFWAGLTYDNNNGATPATAAQLDQLGQGLFSPPTIGSSLDQMFVTGAAGSFLASNPAGSLNNFGGTPPANFGWEFNVDQQVPTQPSTFGRIKSQYR